MSRNIYSAVAFMVAALAQVSLAAWDGSAKVPKVVKDGGSDYYEITSPEELIGFLDSVLVGKTGDESLKAYLKNDIVFGADTSKLCEKRWVRNSEQSMFTGEFDGRGHSIYGLNAEKALFREVGMSAGSVHDFSVVHGNFGSDTAFQSAAIVELLDADIWNVNVIETDVRAVYAAAGIAANVNSPYGSDGKYSLILNSNVIGGSVGASFYVGGIAGYSAGQIRGCTNSARIFAFENPTDKTSAYIGGIVAYSTVNAGVGVGNCINRGSIEIESSAHWSYVGGIAGEVDGNIENLQNYGNVSSKSTFASESANSDWIAYSYVGGIVGLHSLPRKFSGDNRDLLNEGNILAVFDNKIENGQFMVGGVVGCSYRTTITNALNRGSVVAHGFGKLMKSFVGGVIGQARMTAYSSGFDKLKNRGDVYGGGTFRTHVGGLVGWMEGYVGNNPMFFQSFNYGSVTGVAADSSSESEALNVGGIAGYSNAVIFSDVYNRGTLLAKGKLKYGGSYVGGIVGLNSYPTSYISNAYSATSELVGDTVGGVVGYSLETGIPQNTYFDKTLADITSYGKDYFETSKDPDCNRTTAELQSDEMLAKLNTKNGEVDDRKLWVRRGGYPVLTFDSLYKNDSIFFDTQKYALPSAEVVSDTVVYTIKTADELSTLLETGTSFGYKMFKVKLANDIVMGEDSTHLSMRKMSIDTSGQCINMKFDGQGHTVYGLNMTRAMFYCVADGAVIENMTIANSRFANDYGMSAAAVAIKNGSCVRNVTVRNSLVQGGDAVGGIVAYNEGLNDYGVLLNSKNENTTVISSNIAGGIAGDSYGVLQNVSNTGRVYGRLAGGIVGYAYRLLSSPALVSKGYNTGMVIASGEGAVSGGGIVGYGLNAGVHEMINTGLVEGASVSGSLSVGGLVGNMDSTRVENSGNWGRVHALSGKRAYVGGLIGFANGYIAYAKDVHVAVTGVAENFNYGPVTVKESVNEAYAAGLVGKGKGLSLVRDYNRGTVKNDAQKSVSAGIIAMLDTSTVGDLYSYAEVLSGKNVANVVYEIQGDNIVGDIAYGSNMNYPAYVEKPGNVTFQNDNMLPMSFEKMKYASMVQALDGFSQNYWLDKGCLPVLRHDTTSGCSEASMKDSFGDSDEPYVVGYKETVVFADSSSSGGEGGTVAVEPNYVLKLLPSMRVAVSDRNISVTGLPENHAVAVFDMRGRMVSSARVRGAEVRLAVPRTGRYIVRSGSQSRIVTVK